MNHNTNSFNSFDQKQPKNKKEDLKNKFLSYKNSFQKEKPCSKNNTSRNESEKNNNSQAEIND